MCPPARRAHMGRRIENKTLRKQLRKQSPLVAPVLAHGCADGAAFGIFDPYIFIVYIE
jgi:hypothetical protein